MGLTIVGVSVDGPRNHNKVRPFVKRMGLTYPVAIDQDGRLQQLYHVVALPTAVLIDTSGVVATARIGFRPGEGKSLEQKIEALLSSSLRDSPLTPARTSP
jgi:peroxiredoxin